MPDGTRIFTGERKEALAEDKNKAEIEGGTFNEHYNGSIINQKKLQSLSSKANSR